MIDEDEKTSMHQVSSLNLMLKKKQQSPCLIVVAGKASAGKMFKLQGEMVIGRSVNAEIHLDDDGVSRKHAKVVVMPDGSVEVHDLGSTNGTYFADERIDRRVLKDGDKIQIGSTLILKFSYQDALDESLQQNLYESATRDGLTRLYNKKHFIDALKKEFAYALRNHVELSLVMFDVDFFKRVNDTHGHLAGDFVLQRLAGKVGECIRTEDTLARYGGEEFALVLREISEEKAITCAERIRRVIETTDFTFNGTRMPVTISLGIATFQNGNFTTIEQLIESADSYLYRAKRGGRNRVECRLLSGPLVGRHTAPRSICSLRSVKPSPRCRARSRATVELFRPAFSTTIVPRIARAQRVISRLPVSHRESVSGSTPMRRARSAPERPATFRMKRNASGVCAPASARNFAASSSARRRERPSGCPCPQSSQRRARTRARNVTSPTWISASWVPSTTESLPQFPHSSMRRAPAKPAQIQGARRWIDERSCDNVAFCFGLLGQSVTAHRAPAHEPSKEGPVNFDEANVWCMDHKVEVASTNDGKTLQLSAHGHAVSAELADGSWYTWKETFIRLVARLREQLPSPAGSNGDGPGENGSRKPGGSKRRQFRRTELAITL